MSNDESNRRRAERVPINDEFGEIRVARTTYVSDLSEHGVFVHTEAKLPIGTTIALRFTVVLDDPVVIEGLGRVVRHSSQPPGLGVEFGPLSPQMVLRIQDALNRQRPLDPGAPVRTVVARGKFTRLREDEFEDARTGAFQAVPRLIPELADDDVEDVEETIEVSKTEKPAKADKTEKPAAGDEGETVVDARGPTKVDPARQPPKVPPPPTGGKR